MTSQSYSVDVNDTREFFGFYMDNWLFAFTLCLVVLFLYITIEISKRFKPTFYTQIKKEFEERNGYSYDYVFVFKVHQEEDLEKLNQEQIKFSMKRVVDRLENADLGIKCFYSCQRDEIYVKVRGDPERLLAEAARVNYKLLLDPENLKIAGESGKKVEKRYIWRPFTISNEKQRELFDPYVYIYGKYCTEPAMHSLYTVYKVNPYDEADFVREHILKPVDRIKLLLTIFEANVNESPPGCGLDLKSMEANGVVLSHFPLHDLNQLVRLQRAWVRFFSFNYEIPLDEVKDYFGEKIGLYFAFLKYYGKWLRIPAVLGIFVYGWNTITNSNSTYIAAIFGAGFVVWCTLIAENWKGEQKTIAMKWGTAGFEDEETERNEFQGVHTPSPIDGSDTIYYSASNRLLVNIFINSVIGSFVALAVVGVVIMVQLQNFLTTDNSTARDLSLVGRNYSAYVTSAVLVVLIEVFRRGYWKVAVWLNDIQNHRTETNYEDGLVYTVFIFQFANCYFYPIWLAFGKPFSQYECNDNNCLEELQQSLLVLTFLPILIHCIEEVVIGKISQLKKLNEETSDLEPGVQVGHIEQQYILAQYNVLEGSFKDYSAVMSTFGYVSMFVAAFPNGVLIALISTEVRMRIDGWKLCHAFRRPQPQKAEDIGIWETVMNFLSIIAVTITFGIICFSSSYLIDVTWSYRWVYFIVLEHITIMIKFCLILVIDDVPEEVEVQLKRQDFIVSKIIEDEEDETEDVFKSTQRAQDFRLTFYDEDFDIPLPPDTTEPNLTIYELMEMKNIEVYPYVEPEKDQETKEE